jgi:hypothetical protein
MQALCEFSELSFEASLAWAADALFSRVQATQSSIALVTNLDEARLFLPIPKIYYHFNTAFVHPRIFMFQLRSATVAGLFHLGMEGVAGGTEGLDTDLANPSTMAAYIKLLPFPVEFSHLPVGQEIISCGGMLL